MIEIDPDLAFTLKQFAKEMILPPSGFATLAFLSLLLARLRRKSRRLGTGVALLALLALYLTSTDPASRWLIHQVEANAGPALDEAAAKKLMSSEQPPQALVILGGGLSRDDREKPYDSVLSPGALLRVHSGARLARWTGLPVLTAGGGAADASITEGDLMARVLKEDLLAAVRWVENKSRDTADNASMTAQILKPAKVQHIVLLTEAYHMWRSRAAFEAQGFTVTTAPVGFLGGQGTNIQSYWIPSPESRRRSRQAWRELAGYYWYWVRRNYIAPYLASAAQPPATAGNTGQ